MMNPPPLLQQALGSDQSYQRLQRHLRQLLRLQNVLDKEWPSLHLRVRNLKEDQLTLTTLSAAQASRLRQIEPSLLLRLQKQEPQITRIAFKPQTRNTRAAPVDSRSRNLSANTLKVISEQMKLSGHPAVKKALEKMLTGATRQ